MKQFEFEDGSKVTFEFTEEGFAITMQAKRLGTQVVFTSARAVLDNNNLTELVNWIGEILLEENNG